MYKYTLKIYQYTLHIIIKVKITLKFLNYIKYRAFGSKKYTENNIMLKFYSNLTKLF